MAKLFVLIALCIAGAIAGPSGHHNVDIALSAERAVEPMAQMAEALKSVDGDLATCLVLLKNEMLETLKRNGLAARACVADCVDEVMVIHDDVWNSWVKAAGLVNQQIGALVNCEDLACKQEAYKQIAVIIIENARDVSAIIADGVIAITAEYPEAYQCTKEAFVSLFRDLHVINQEFIACVKA